MTTLPAVAGAHPALAWRPLATDDLPALTTLAGQCLAGDGGQPFFADPGFVRSGYLSGAETIGGFNEQTLVCASSLRIITAGSAGQTPGPGFQAVTTGMVAPAWRRRRIGSWALDWALTRARAAAAMAGTATLVRAESEESAGSPALLRAESEALSDGAHALYLARGLKQILAEDVMQLAADEPGPSVTPPPELTLTEWPAASPARFFALYQAAFRERPGFPDPTEAEWSQWLSDDEDFVPAWTLLASLDGVDLGYVAGERTGWIAQVGVIPQARGRAVGAHLIAEVVRRMRAAGETTMTLNVNVNNPHAAGLYRRLGFRRTGRRSRYQGPI